MRPHIDYGKRSRHDAKDWLCTVCHTENKATRKLVFDIPKFVCPCGKEYLEDHDLVFNLADVKLNGLELVKRVFTQKGPECVANACCQQMQMNHVLDCVLNEKQPDPQVLDLDPGNMVRAYEDDFPKTRSGGADGMKPAPYHKTISMMLSLRKKGIKLRDGTFYKIGDVSYVPGDNYEALCEQLADGVPLLTVFVPGRGFGELEYCQLYNPPSVESLVKCNNRMGKPHILHRTHMVVLLGPATNHITGERGFFFMNSHGVWCLRSLTDNPDIVKYGIGKVLAGGLVTNAIKFWLPGERADSAEHRFEDEDETGPDQYNLKAANVTRYIRPRWGRF